MFSAVLVLGLVFAVYKLGQGVEIMPVDGPFEMEF